MEGLFQTLTINDVTVKYNNENGYEMKNIAGLRNQITDIRGIVHTKEGMIG